MKCLDLSMDTAEENLALDEALLDQADRQTGPDEVLRLWEPAQVFAVIGRSSRIAQEANLEACAKQHIPVLRRCSGGAAVLTGPGCLMYSVVLNFQRRPQLRAIEAAHCFVLQTVRRAIGRIVPGIEMCGTSDLALNQRKFSGNSLRLKHDHMLYHGTILYAFPLELIGQYLRTPPRQPDYRRGRGHLDFVTNLPVTVQQLRHELLNAWSIDQQIAEWPRDRVAELVATRYSQASWNRRM